jgi:transcriptional regulator NrdR family protein
MKCPVCGTYTEVIDSRLKNDNTRRRRYMCANEHRFTTLEILTKETKCSTPTLTNKTGLSG